MPRILIVEDEAAIAGPLSDFLELQGYEVTCAADGPGGLEVTATWEPDLVLLDIMLPKQNGLDVCRAMRERGLDAPIIMLTAKGQEEDKIAGLDAGADDYVTKPFSVKELDARIRAQLRRANGETASADAYSFGDVTVSFRRREVVKAGVEQMLATMEFELLRYFIEHRGEALPRSRLLTEVWGYQHPPSTRTVDTHVLNLRRKLERDPHEPEHIVTVHGVGYKFTG